MGTYLLTWNPKRWEFEKLEWFVEQLMRGKPVPDTRWSCGNRKGIEVGERVFLLRQGNQYPGIAGSGWVSKGTFRAPSWDSEKRKQGLKTWYVLVDWQMLLMPEVVLGRDELLKGILPEKLLKTAASGIKIDSEFVEKLESAWANHCKIPLMTATKVLSAVSASEGEYIENKGYRRKRDQRLRRAALDASGGVCEACGVDYNRVLGGKGLRVLQVHHKCQLSELDKPRVNTVEDLAVVCANCHALIHSDSKKALGIDLLKQMLKSQSA